MEDKHFWGAVGTVGGATIMGVFRWLTDRAWRNAMEKRLRVLDRRLQRCRRAELHAKVEAAKLKTELAGLKASFAELRAAVIGPSGSQG